MVMPELILTRASIEADIKEYQVRIQSARDSLAVLPATAPTFKERKKLERLRHGLLSEIAHVNIIMDYAREALEEGVNS